MHNIRCKQKGHQEWPNKWALMVVPILSLAVKKVRARKEGGEPEEREKKAKTLVTHER